APDQSTAIGKRDYAIMLLAVQIGLRACDIVRMKRENIDWRARKINIVQHKTGKPLSLPLPSEAGNAIAEYLLYHRPDCELPHIFLCHTGQLRPLKNRSASGMVSKYMRRIGLYDPEKRRSFHSFRRTFGTDLLKNEIPMELIQQMLGHTQMNSMKPYLSVEEEVLKRCALSLLPSSQEVVQE
ncbi:MAG: tyrosine-type recombinase/integrase, partial [Oscillospiraceae bacterium]|nr:tyrosine-type recombinase/integrase [Oscillospiraceae bacterium]